MTKPTSVRSIMMDKKNKSSWRAMCTDLEAAALNRKRVSEGYGDAYWLALEARQKEEEMKEIGSIIRIRKR